MIAENWQNRHVWVLMTKSSLFCRFWEITLQCKTGNTIAKFCIPLKIGRIAGQFWSWNLEGKNSQLFAINYQILAKLACLGADDKIQFFCQFWKMMGHGKFSNNTSSFAINHKEEGYLVIICIETLTLVIKKNHNSLCKIDHF